MGQAVTYNYKTDGGVLSPAVSYSDDGELKIDPVITNGQSNVPVSIAIDVSQVKSFLLLSTQDVTFKTNSSGSPTNTIALKAGKPYVWTVDSYDTFKLTGDVTIVYITNASGADATVTLRGCYDSTP